jgi:hypothetical protein
VNEELDVRKRVAFDLAMDNMLSVSPSLGFRVAFDLAMDNMLSVSPAHGILECLSRTDCHVTWFLIKILMGGLDLAVPGLGDEGSKP